MIHALITIGLVGLGLYVVVLAGCLLLGALGAALIGLARFTVQTREAFHYAAGEVGTALKPATDFIDRILPKWL